MLHKINPVCVNQFAWVGGLQKTLLEYACDEETSPADTTEGNLYALFEDVDENWFKGILRKKDKVTSSKQTLLDSLKILAGADNTQKQVVLNVYTNNQNIAGLYEENCQIKIRKISELNNFALETAYRGYLSAFYDPLFYDNFPTCEDGEVVNFDRRKLVKSFTRENDLSVCVLCDMDLNDPDVDHFFSKKEFPELSCNTGNLVPICKSCNGRARKGEKPPLDFDDEEQCKNWFHPYYRQIDWEAVNIDFPTENNKVLPKLVSADQTLTCRLSKLNELLGVDERWRKKLPHIVRTTIKQLRKKKVAKDKLPEVLLDMAESKECEIGELSTAILSTAFLHAAANGESYFIDEIHAELY